MKMHVLGIDVGYSQIRRSTGLCLISIDGDSLQWQCHNTFTDRNRRISDLRDLVPRDTSLLGVGIDGPLASSLQLIENYRAADALLSKGPFQQRGKPGQTSSPVGQKLHEHATLLAQLVLELQDNRLLSVTKATHPDSVHSARIVEAFPTAFLSVLLAEDDFTRYRGRNASDVYWEVAVQQGYLSRLLDFLAPQARPSQRLEDLSDHDHRAAFICALTALSVAWNHYVAVGDPADGDMILPEAECWGLDRAGQRWAEVALRANLFGVRANQQRPNHMGARVLRNGVQWIP